MKPIVEHQKLDLEKLEDSTHLLDILIQCENVLDSLDVYVYKNWFKGEVARGPIVRRHWVTIDLRYPKAQMPDPRAALRLLKHGVQVEFNRMKQEQAGDVTHPDYEPGEPTDWLITLTFPRRLLDATEEADLEIYDDEINPDDVTAAKDIGLDNETPYQADEQAPNIGQDMGQEQGMLNAPLR